MSASFGEKASVTSSFEEVIEISDAEKEAAFQVARKVAKQEGLLIGMSSG
jgi:cysteine synthase